MHLLVVLLGGASAGLTAGMLRACVAAEPAGAIGRGLAVAVVYVLVFQAAYYIDDPAGDDRDEAPERAA